MELDSSQLSLTRVRCTLPAAKCLLFTPDGSSLVVVTHEGVAYLAMLDSVNPHLLKAFDKVPGYVTSFLKQPVLIFETIFLCTFQNVSLNLILAAV